MSRSQTSEKKTVQKAVFGLFLEKKTCFFFGALPIKIIIYISAEGAVHIYI